MSHGVSILYKLRHAAEQPPKHDDELLGEVISHEPSLAARLMTVLHAKSLRWEGVNLVVKISWPGSGWGTENEFLDKATSEAKSTTDDRRALKREPLIHRTYGHAAIPSFDMEFTLLRVGTSSKKKSIGRCL